MSILFFPSLQYTGILSAKAITDEKKKEKKKEVEMCLMLVLF
jgi:hypothetical protein